MALVYQNWITVNPATWQIVGVGNLTQSSSGVSSWWNPAGTVYAPNGQIISPWDPNYINQTYQKQNLATTWTPTGINPYANIPNVWLPTIGQQMYYWTTWITLENIDWRIYNPISSANNLNGGIIPASNKQWQILNTEAMKQYQPSEYQRLSDGRVVLNPGVTPKTGTVKETQFELPPVSAPKNVGAVWGAGTYGTATGQYGYPDVSSAISNIAWIKTGIAEADAAFNQRLLQIQELEKAKAAANKPLLDKLLGTKSPEQAALDAWNQIGIDPKGYYAEQKAKIAEIEALSQDYNSTVAAKDAQINQATDRMASTNFMNNQIAQINRNAAVVLNQKAANINAKTATLEALRGNFESARSYVNEAVKNATATFEYNYNLYKTFAEINQEQFNALDSVYKEAYSFAVDKAKSDYETTYNEKQKVGELMITYNAGININDSLETAYQKIARSGGKTYKTTGWGGGANNLPTWFEAQVQKAVTDLQQGESWGTVFNRMKTFFPTVSDAQIDMALGKDQWSQPGAYEKFKGKIEPTPKELVEKAKNEWFNKEEVLTAGYPKAIVEEVFKEETTTPSWRNLWWILK